MSFIRGSLKGLRPSDITHPPAPLPLIREGGVKVREGQSPLSKISSPSPFKEREIKGVRLIIL